MNQENVKELLAGLYDCKEDYRVIFSGRKNGKVNGLYKPDSREIVIHNRNFTVDDSLMYTAIHELAHHVMDTEYGFRGARSHTRQFWAVFHDLLDKAVNEGIYTARPDGETGALLEEARRISREIAELRRRLGRVLSEIAERCEKQGLRAEDFIERGAQISRETSRDAVAAAELNLPGEFGDDVQEAALRERDPEARLVMLAAAEQGKSVAQAGGRRRGRPGRRSLPVKRRRWKRRRRDLRRPSGASPGGS